MKVGGSCSGDVGESGLDTVCGAAYTRARVTVYQGVISRLDNIRQLMWG